MEVRGIRDPPKIAGNGITKNGTSKEKLQRRLVTLGILFGLCSSSLIIMPDGGGISSWSTPGTLPFDGPGSSFQDCQVDNVSGMESVRLSIHPEWIQLHPTTNPAPRFSGTTATIAYTDEVLMFGGYDGTNRLNDTYVFDLSSGTWTILDLPESPPARQNHGMAALNTDDKIVVFGGLTDTSPLNDTWVFDASEQRWHNMTPSRSPSARFSFAMASIFNDDKIVLHGGCADYSDLNFSDETWIYDVGDNDWTRQDIADSPGARAGHASATLWNDDTVVMFGGWSRSGDLNDTWLFDAGGRFWKKLAPQTAPAPRDLHGMAMVSNDDKVILFGGSSSGRLSDTWIYDALDDDWSQQKPSHTPPAQYYPGMAGIYNTTKTLLFEESSDGRTSETWVFDVSALSPSGEYRSPYFSTGGRADALALNLSADIPAGTYVHIRVRTGSSEGELAVRDFTGPDGTLSTYYSDGSQIFGDDENALFFQYNAILGTSNLSLSPTLRSVTINYNRCPLEPLILEPVHNDWTNQSRPNFRWRFEDLDSTNQSAYEWQTKRPWESNSSHSSGIINESQAAYFPDDPLEDGFFDWRLRTKDNDGSWGPFSDWVRFGIDTVAPLPFNLIANDSGWTNHPITLSFDTTDGFSGLDRYELRVDDALLGAETSPFNLEYLADGVHRVSIRAYDKAGNYYQDEIRVLQDRTAPRPFYPTCDPPGWVNGSLSLSFQAYDDTSGIDHYEVQVDQGRFLRMSSPSELAGIEDGVHSVVVRAFDRAGNAFDATLTLAVDGTPPMALIVSALTPGWTNTDPTIIFSADDTESGLDRFEISVDDGRFFQQESPAILRDLSEGEHLIKVRAYDRASNFIEGHVKTWIDRTSPEPFLPMADPSGWSNSDPTISFSTGDNGSGIDRYEISIAEGGLFPVSSPCTITNLTEGESTIRVRAFDKAGNWIEAITTVFQDTVPPVNPTLTFENGLKLTTEMEVEIKVTAIDNSSGLDSVRFSNDGTFFSIWEPINGTHSWKLTGGAGIKTVYMQVRDKAGNIAPVALARIEYRPSGSNIEMLYSLAIVIIAFLSISVVIILHWRKSRRRC